MLSCTDDIIDSFLSFIRNWPQSSSIAAAAADFFALALDLLLTKHNNVRRFSLTYLTKQTASIIASNIIINAISTPPAAPPAIAVISISRLIIIYNNLLTDLMLIL